MKRAISVSAIALTVGGCAYVPEIETESSLSYADIVNQAECEVYWAGEDIWRQKDANERGNYAYPEYRPDNYSVSIVINPSDQVASSANIGVQLKDTTKGTQYLQWLVSSSSPASNATGVNAYGKAAGTNTYKFNTSNVYAQVEFDPKDSHALISKDLYDGHVNGKWKILSYYTDKERKALPGSNLPTEVPKIIQHYANKDDRNDDDNDMRDGVYEAIVDTTPYVSRTAGDQSGPVPYFFFSIIDDNQLQNIDAYAKGSSRIIRAVNYKIHRACNSSPPLAGSTIAIVDERSPLNGGLGIEPYIERTIAADRNGLATADSFTFEKEYRSIIQVGITPGWYIPHGDYLPNAGAGKTIDDDIKFTFASIAPNSPPKPSPVYIVKNPGVGVPVVPSAAAGVQARKVIPSNTNDRLNTGLSTHQNNEAVKSIQQVVPQ